MKNKKVIVVAVILALILGLALTAGIMINHKLDKIVKVNEPDDIIAPESEFFETEDHNDTLSQMTEIEPNDVDWDEVDPVNDDNLINILLIGQDRREGQPRQRSDSMVLCSINTDTGKISMISFLRDLYVRIPGGYSDNRLNMAYAFGGFPLLIETLKQNFGVKVDGCFEVDFGGFENVINILGGVDVTLTDAEARVVGDGVSSGMNHLNGKQALAYSRIRKIDSDFGRTQRQRNVLTSIFKELKNSSVSEIWTALDEILPLLTTDMSNGEIISLVTKLIPIIKSGEITTYCVPDDDSFYYATIRGMSVIVPDLDKIHERLLNEYLPLN